MKRVWTLIMVLVILTKITELHELGRLPLLFEHFSEHQERNAAVTFTEFLAMHYWGQDLNDDDDSRDRELPFKKADFHPIHLSHLPLMSGVKIKSAVFWIRLNYPIYHHHYTPDAELAVPFRPPCA
jgi:hypothetical protein